MSDLISIIEDAFENRASISPTTVETSVREAIEQAIDQLDRGEVRVAEKIDGQWVGQSMAKKGRAAFVRCSR